MKKKWRHLPNLITFFRLAMVFPFLYCALTEHYTLAFFIFAIASISDGLDGHLARRFDWQSKIGAFTDPLADKCLVISSYVALTINHQLPLWFTILVVSRDVVISLGSLWVAVFRNIEFKPTYISKVNTVFQLLLISILLFQLSYPVLPPNLVPSLIILTTLTTTYSFIDYVVRWTYILFIKKPV
jgi:cardiolipin synthase